MYQEPGSGKGILFFVLLVILVGGVFVIFGGDIGFTKNLHSKIFGDDGVFNEVNAPVQMREIIVPPKAQSWCKIQEMEVGTSNEDPVRDRIVGWDNLDNCCVREISGYNCALGRDSSLRFCFTSHIGGEIKYVQVDGYFIDSTYYKEMMNDYDKTKIENKVCDGTKYGVAK